MEQQEPAVTGDGPVGGPRGTPPGRLAYSAAAAGVLLGAGHLGVTGGSVVLGQQAPTPSFLAWMFVPVATARGFAAAAVSLVRPGTRRRRWPLWVCGTAAVLMVPLALAGLAPLAFGASPGSLFLGPGPYALPGAVLFTVLTVTARRARGRARPPAHPRVPPPDSVPESGRTPA